MNAAAKHKDIMSKCKTEIVKELERRITLYKRIMTAVQRGEKGVTIVELRNKPPVIVRNGAIYHCPSNRAPKEPDGGGALLCEDDITPSPIMYDSCLSAEDKDLLVADNKYFFCNRHRTEGPDMPRNGTRIMACSDIERTSLNYTMSKCALEDSMDVVANYRSYPDKTYKYVMELDPDHEMCDHWDPCQIGYIFALPGYEEAKPAVKLWHGWKDVIEEHVHHSTAHYRSSPRRFKAPAGYFFLKLYAKRISDNAGWEPDKNSLGATTKMKKSHDSVVITHYFPEKWSDQFYSNYFAVFRKKDRKTSIKAIKYLTIYEGATKVVTCKMDVVPGQTVKSTAIPFKCPRCRLMNLVVRSLDESVHNIDPGKYRLKDHAEKKKYLEIDLQQPKIYEFGDYYAIVQNSEGMEERVKVLELQVIEVTPLRMTYALGSNIDEELPYSSCDVCEFQHVYYNGLNAGTDQIVSHLATRGAKKFTFTVNSYEDTVAGVYTAIFLVNGTYISKVIAIFDNVKILNFKTVEPPDHGVQFEHIVHFSCSQECNTTNVIVNGNFLDVQKSHRSGTPSGGGSGSGGSGSIAFYMFNKDSITIRITEYSDTWRGMYQAVFSIGSDAYTKNVLEIGNCSDNSDNPASKAKPTAKLATSPVKHGQPAELTCEAEGKDHKFSWQFKKTGADKFTDISTDLFHHLADDGQKLKINNVKNAAGVYKCTANNEESNEVQVNPEGSDSDGGGDKPTATITTTPVEANKKADLKCQVHGSPTDSDPVKWSFKKTGATDFTDVNDKKAYVIAEFGQSLTITNVNEQSMGSYKCNFHNAESSEIQVKADAASSGGAKPTAKLIKGPEGDDKKAELECAAEGATDAEPITWSFKKTGEAGFKDIASGTGYNIQDDGEKLTIKNVDKNTVGAYKCIAHNTESDQVEVNPEGSDSDGGGDKPTATITTTPVEANKKADLKCQVHGSPTDSDPVKWSFKKTGATDFTDVNDKKAYVIAEFGEKLRINNVDEKTMGSYKCNFQNAESSEIEVKADAVSSGGAKPTAKLIKGPEGDDKKAELECAAEGATDAEPITWSFKKTGEAAFKDIASGTGYVISDQGKKLEVTVVGPDTEGAYTCKYKGAESSEVAVAASGGATPAEPDLKPEEPPTDKPEEPTIKPEIVIEPSIIRELQSVVISCTGADDDNAAEFFLNGNPTLDGVSLLIESYKEEENGGEYICKVGDATSDPKFVKAETKE